MNVMTQRLLSTLDQLELPLPEEVASRLQVHQLLEEKRRESHAARGQGAQADPADLAGRVALEAAREGKPLPDVVKLARGIEQERQDALLEAQAWRSASEKAGGSLEAGLKAARDEILGTVEKALIETVDKAAKKFEGYPVPMEAESLLGAPERERKSYLELAALAGRYIVLREATKILNGATFGKSATADGDGVFAEFKNGGELRHGIAGGTIPPRPDGAVESLRWITRYAQVHAPNATIRDALREAWNARVREENKGMTNTTAKDALEKMVMA